MCAERTPQLAGIFNNEHVVYKPAVMLNLTRKSKDWIEARLDFGSIHYLNDLLFWNQ